MTSDERNAPEYRSSLGLHHTPSTSPQTTAGSTEIPKNDNSPTNSRKRVADVLDAAQALDYEDPNSDSSIRERQASDDFKHAMAKRSGRVSRPLKYRRLTERPGLIDERRPIHLDENLTEEQKKLEFGALLQLKLNNLANFFDMAPDAQLLMMNPQQQQEILARVKARFVQGKNSSPKEDWMHLSYDMRRHIIANASRKGPRPKKAAKKTKS